MANYVNTPVYANQISKKQQNKNGNSFYFVRLNASETLKSKTMEENYGNIKAISIMVPDFAVKGAIVSKQADKVYNLDKNNEGKVIEFDPLLLNENKEKVGGKHILATISLKLPEDEIELNDESKVKVIFSIFNEKTQSYENKTMTTSYKKLTDDLFKQNTIAVTNSIKKYKDKAKDIFSEIELANQIKKEVPKNNFDFDLIDDMKSKNDDSILWEDDIVR